MSARPTILQIIPRLDTGGAELSTLEVTAALVRAGARALIATEGGRLVPQVERAGGEIVSFPAASKNPATILANALRLGRLIHRERIDLIHARSRAPAWSALMAARRAGIPFVTTYHGAYAGKGAIKTWYNGIMARGDVVIANSQFTADLIAARHGTPKTRIEVIHRGIDPAEYDPQAVAPGRIEALRSTWNVAPGQKVVLQAARLTGWKGQRVLIEAARLLHGQGRLGDTVVVLAGDAQGRDGYREELLALIQAAGLSDRTRLPGHCEDMPAAFALAHVAVVASTEPEAFGRATAEALAMGCPVIATSIGAPPEIVLASPPAAADVINGWLVPPGDAAALADRLAEALALSGQSHAAMGERARRHVIERFTVRAMQRATLEVYDRLISSGLATRFDAAAVRA